MTPNHKPNRLPLTSSDALLATYLAGCITVSLTIPYQQVGFASVPATSFAHIATALSPFVAAVVYFSLFFAIVMLSGSRLLVGLEAIEHHNVFAKQLSESSHRIQLLERWLRVACIVFAEALLIFATLPGSALFIALTTCTVLMLVWDVVIWQAVKTTQGDGSVSEDRVRLGRWVRTDLLCFVGLVIGFGTALVGRSIGPQSTGSGPDSMSAFDTLLITAAATYGILVMVAVVFEVLDQFDIYGNALRVVPLSLLLSLVFLAIILLSGGSLKALVVGAKPSATTNQGMPE